MKPAFDLVLRGGTIVDGSPDAERFEADVAILDGKIAEVGSVVGHGREEIDARDRLVLPGFVDLHTHYDAQVTWEERIRPSSDHGVTTVVMGNCAVGVAPCEPEHRDLLAMLVSAVEDIPEDVLKAGLPWSWTSFPEYLDALEARHYDMDVAALVAHTPLRLKVLGERGTRREMATRANLVEIERLAVEALRAGAVGVSSSRCSFHRTPDGDVTPVEVASDGEVMALARALRTVGAGVYQFIVDFHDTTEDYSTEFDLLRRVCEVSGRRPTFFSLLEDPRFHEAWPSVLRRVDVANDEGLPIRPQVNPRSPGTLFGLDMSFCPLTYHPTYRALAGLPLAERVAELRKEEVRARILAEKPECGPEDDPNLFWMCRRVGRMYPLDDPPDYEPPPDATFAAIAERGGLSVDEVVYDYLLESEGRSILFLPGSNYRAGNLDCALTMMKNPNAIVSLGDGGAHCGYVCDASFSTFLLTHWVRDREGERVALPWAVHALTRKPALAIGFEDRGLVAPGFKADLNVVDFDRLRLHRPEPVFDLPARGRRVVQRADGYEATLVDGEVVYREGVATGALPGRLVRRGSATSTASA